MFSIKIRKKRQTKRNTKKKKRRICLINIFLFKNNESFSLLETPHPSRQIKFPKELISFEMKHLKTNLLIKKEDKK